MSGTKLKLLYILDILKETDENSPITAESIGKKLELYGIIAERKSICRDINLLIDYGYDINICKDKRYGWFIGSREFEDWEIKVLIDAITGAKFLTSEQCNSIAEKLKSFASKDSKKLFSVVSPIKSTRNSNNSCTKIYIDEILKAIRTGKKIVFQYTTYDTDLKKQLKRDGHEYIVNPYSLVWQNERYYLICSCDSHDNLAHFRLDRMANLRVSDDPLRPSKEIVGANPSLAISKFVSQSLYHYGGEKMRIILSCDDYMADEIVDYFGTDIRISKFNDGFEVTIEVNDGNGLYYWLMQHGANIKVVSPQKVIDTLKTKLQEAIDLYK